MTTLLHEGTYFSVQIRLVRSDTGQHRKGRT